MVNFCSFVLLSKIIVNTHACVLSNKKAESQAPKVQTLKEQKYVKLA